MSLSKLKNILDIFKGGPGSGHWGHASKPGQRGGSLPASAGMSFVTGSDAKRRQALAKNNPRGFFKGNLKTATMQEIYDGSSKEVQELADKTGVIAVDEASLKYIGQNQNRLKPKIDKVTFNREDALKSLDGYLDNISKRTDYRAQRELLTKTPQEYEKILREDIKDSPVPELLLKDRYGSLEKTWTGRWIRITPKQSISLSKDEERILESLKKYETKTLGWHGARMQKAVDNLSDRDKKTLENLRVKISMEAKPNDALSKSYKTAYMWYKSDNIKSIISLSDSKDFTEKYPIKANETYGDYVKRMWQTPEFKAVVPDKRSDSKSVSVKDMISIKSVGDLEKNDIIKKSIDSDWDRVVHGGMKPWVHNVFTVKSSGEVQRKYEENARKYGNIKTGAYHGTDVYAARMITSKGFLDGGGMMGNGTYIANKSSKSAQYLRGGAGSFSRHGARGVLFIVDAALGKVVPFRSREYYGRLSKGTSVYGRKGNNYGHKLYNDEWVLKDSSAVMPRYWIDLSLK